VLYIIVGPSHPANEGEMFHGMKIKDRELADPVLKDDALNKSGSGMKADGGSIGGMIHPQSRSERIAR
jgi:hypothetical protein